MTIEVKTESKGGKRRCEVKLECGREVKMGMREGGKDGNVNWKRWYEVKVRSAG